MVTAQEKALLSELSAQGPLLEALLSEDKRAEAAASDPKPMPQWVGMTARERGYTLQAMSKFGGGFVAALASAWQRADTVNAAVLGAAFPDVVRQYGPGSDAYLLIEGLYS